MTNTEYPTIQMEQPSDLSGTSPDSPITPKKKRGKKFWILIIIAIGILGCVTLCVSFAVLSFFRSNTEKEPIQKVLDTYMLDMKNKDAEGAYELFTPRVKKKVPLEVLENLTKGNNYIIFEGYQSLSIQKLLMKRAFNTNPDLPQGDVATFEADVKYTGGIIGHLQATLEKNGDIWTIYYVNVTVPPDKIGGKSY